MDDEQLDRLLDAARRKFDALPPPPLEEIWRGVEAELDRPAVAPRRAWWPMIGVAAAALLVGVIGGRYSMRQAAPLPTATSAAAPLIPASDPARRATERFLGQTAVLLASLPHDAGDSALSPLVATQGAQLLGTTRLLLESPVAEDTRLRNLLLDLELVLVQVARLEPRRDGEDLRFIQSALDEHDIVPRLHHAVVDLSSGSL